MSLTFLELKTESRQILFPAGESENLVTAHDRFFNDALWDLSVNVPCYAFGNVNVVKQCATYFNCGMTVLPAPRGRILKVYTIGKQRQAESSESDADTISGETSSQTSGSTNANISAATIANGQIVGQASFQQAIFNPPQTDLSVCTIIENGAYSIAVDQQYIVPAGYEVANSPQYLRTTISYVDSNGVTQVIQPASDAHQDGVKQAGALNVQIKAGTTIKCTMTPFNTPYSDGGFDVNVVVKKVSGTIGSGSGGSGNGNGGSNSGGAGGESGENNTALTRTDDWCSKVFYDQVEYCHIEEYVKLSRHCGTPNSKFASALIFNLFGCGNWRNKRRYPCPTDAGFESLPSLPQGFHYPQASTDAGGRSRGGVWALYRGRIYIAPWIESDETVVVEWNGIKDNWSDDDLVEDDSKFRQAVRLNVAVQHFTLYEQNPQNLIVLETQYRECLRDLIHECREQTRIRDCNEAGGSGESARGVGASDAVSALYYNEAQSFTANCPAGQSGAPVTVTIAAGQVGSALSVADANATALARAQANATGLLSCSTAPTTYFNTAQTYTASCPGASGDTPAAIGNSVTVIIPTGQFSSTVSQAAADAAALAAAENSANAQLVCTFYNAPQTFEAQCPSGTTGSNSVTVAAADGDCTSTESQAEANSLALDKATSLATAGLVCVGVPTFLIGNTAQTATFCCPPGKEWAAGQQCRSVTIPAGWYTLRVTEALRDATQAELNAQAMDAARQQANRTSCI